MNSIKIILPFFIVVMSAHCLMAQQKQTYTITADSVKITGCDSAELILENHTQGVKGFLYNMGNGRTVFRKGLEKINDSLYVIGNDSLKYNAWVQGGNAWGKTGILGTSDNNHLGLYTNNTERMRLTNTGKLLVGTTTDNGVNTLQVNGSIFNNYFTNISPSTSTTSGALRLRWGTGDGAYIGFYYQGNFNRRAYIATPSDSRPLVMEDSVAFSFNNTPKVAIGSEWAFNNAKLSVVKSYRQSIDVFNAGRYLTDTTSSIDLQVKSNGNVLVGGGTDNSYKFQVAGSGNVSINPNLSRPADQIKIGGYLNTTDGQNALISTSAGGGAWKPILIERDGNVGLGSGSPTGWLVGSPTLRVNAGGTVSVESQGFYFGSTGGPYNCSALYMYVSNTNEWREGLGTYPNGQNYYFFGTRLATPEGSNKRAPLKIGADQLIFTPGVTDVEAARFSESGNLGIGTASPSAQLHTTGTVRFAGLTNDSTQTRVLVSDASGNLYYRTASSLAANDILHSSLAVNGPVRARSLTLSAAASDWPDYVFDSSYRLPDLEDVEVYVKKHGHLPGITSAGEVARSGINIGETQAMLLQKIEELTLYAVAQEKELQVQNQRNRRQATQLQDQAAEIKTLKNEMSELRKMIMDKINR